nr:TetR/AcrR family transcriptional regulator [Desertihabitans aurantiacus]
MGRGYAATSLQNLVRVSGLGKGSLYATFGGKHELFLRALRRYVDALDAALRESFASAPRAVDALRDYLMMPVGDPAGAAARRGCFLANSTELAAADPVLATEAGRAYESITALLRECVVRAQEEGGLSTQRDPTETARALLAAWQDPTFIGRSGMDVKTLAPTARSLVAQLLQAPDSVSAGG